MGSESCQACGREVPPEALVRQHIVPENITLQAGMPCPRTEALCLTCSDELHNWYSKKVSDMTYDAGTKRFIPKSPAELVKEYEAAYHAFVAYKKRLHKTAE